MDRIAVALQRDGVARRRRGRDLRADLDRYGAAFCGIVAAGAAVAPLAPSSTRGEPDDDAEGQRRKTAPARPRDGRDAGRGRPRSRAARRARRQRGGRAVLAVGSAQRAPPAPISIAPEQPFNIIYSSGTTGAPKGIVQPHGMRWGQFKRLVYKDAVMIVSTPLYSNTTLVAFLPTLAHGGTAVLMPKFDAGQFLRVSQERRATHAMLVPVQYHRIMERADFGQYDLSSYVLKLSTSAPFPAALKADVLEALAGRSRRNLWS